MILIDYKPIDYSEQEKWFDDLIAKNFPQLLKPLTKKELDIFYNFINRDIEDE